MFPGMVSQVRSVFNLNTIHASTQFNNYTSDKEKLAACLTNPALLKVISLQCDMFSQGKIYVYDNDENEIPDDPFLQRIKRPNPLQSESQFLWDFMFWNMLGTANCYVDSAVVDEPANKLYFLDPSKMEWPNDMQREADKLIFSDATIKERDKKLIRYKYDDGTYFEFPLGKLLIMTDLTNGLGNFYKSPSRIDALYKIITNSEHALDSKNINVRYSGKFLVGSSGAINSTGLKPEEKEDIKLKMDSKQTVWPVKTMIDIKRFVENMQFLALDDAYLKDYFLIGNMYNIPRDVLEAYNSSTFENQEKARMSHISYTLQPKGDDLMDAFEDHFGYTEAGKNIIIDWSHLPFMQVFERDRADVATVKINSLTSLLNLGVSLDEANQYLDTTFTIEKPAATGQGEDQSQEATAAAGGEEEGIGAGQGNNQGQ